MSNNSYSPQSHSPLLPAEEGEEWVPVVQWVRKTAVPSTQAGTHESQIVTSPLLPQFAMPTDTPQSFYPSQIWDQSQLVVMNNYYSSPTSTSSPLNNASSPLNNTSFSGSPVDQVFDDFDIDAAIQDSNLFNADQSLLGLTDQSLFGFAHHSLLGLSDEHLLSAPISDPSLFDADLFDTFVDFSGAELGLSPAPASTGSFASSTTAAASPTSFTEGLEGFSVLTLYSSVPSVATPDLTYSSLRTGAQAAGATPDSTTSSPPVSPSSQALFPCTHGHCNHVFDNANNLRRHERKHRSNFKCEICGKPHIDKRGLSRHMWAQHPDEAKQRNTRSEVIKCNECDYTGRSDNVARHARHRHKR